MFTQDPGLYSNYCILSQFVLNPPTHTHKTPQKPYASIDPSFLYKFCVYSEHKVMGAKIKVLDNLKYFTEECFLWVFLLPALNSPRCAKGCKDVAGYCPFGENTEQQADKGCNILTNFKQTDTEFPIL